MTLSEKWQDMGGKRKVESGSRGRRATKEAGEARSWGAEGGVPLG